MANGIVSATVYSPATPFGLDVFAAAREASGVATITDVLVYHGSTDAPTVDVLESSIPAGTVVDSIAYSEFDGYLSLNTQAYTLDVIVNGTTTSAGIFSAPLSSLGLGNVFYFNSAKVKYLTTRKYCRNYFVLFSGS